MTSTRPRWGAMIGFAGNGTRFRLELDAPDRMDWFRRSVFAALEKGASVIYLHNIAGHPPGQNRVTSAAWTACPFADELLPVVEAAYKAFPKTEWWLHANVYISEADPREGYKSPVMNGLKCAASNYRFPQHRDFWQKQLEPLANVVGRAKLRVVADEGGTLGAMEWIGFTGCVSPWSAKPVCEAIPMVESGRMSDRLMPDWEEARAREYAIVRDGHADTVKLPNDVPLTMVGRVWASLEWPYRSPSSWTEGTIEDWLWRGWNIVAADTLYHPHIAELCKRWSNPVL